MLVRTFNEYELRDEFVKMGRDYYSLDGYRTILDLFEECGGTTELDVIGICCDFTEAEPEDIIEDYSNIDAFRECFDDDGNIDTDKLMDALNYYTYAVELENGSILYQNF